MESNNVMGTGVQSAVPGAASPANSMNSTTANSNNGLGEIQSPHQPGIELKRETQTPPANVLQEEAARQQAPHVGYSIVTPGVAVSGQNMPSPQLGMGHLDADQGGNLLPMDQWQPRYPGGAAQVVRQPVPPIIQQGQMGQASMQVNQDAVRPGAGNITKPLNARQRQAFQQLKQTLQSPMQKQALQQFMQTMQPPQCHEKQQQILTILKANPELMKAFIKLRQLTQLQQASGAGAGVIPPQTTSTHVGSAEDSTGFEPGTSDSTSDTTTTMVQTQGQMGQAPMQGNQDAVRPGAGNITNPPNAMQKQALQQLMQTLRSPQSPEQQQQILTILKANPQLMAAFIKQRQRLQQASGAGVGVGSTEHSAASKPTADAGGYAGSNSSTGFEPGTSDTATTTAVSAADRTSLVPAATAGDHAGLHPSPVGQNQETREVSVMTRQDQLKKFVEQL